MRVCPNYRLDHQKKNPIEDSSNMIDWLTIVIALVIITTIVGFFGFLAWKMTMSDPWTGDDQAQLTDSIPEKRKKEKHTSEQGKKKRKEQKKSKREMKDEEQQQEQKRNKPLQTRRGYHHHHLI